MAYDSEQYGREVSRHWLRVGRLLFKAAKEKAEKPGYEKEAVNTARLAEFCMWQATGESIETLTGDDFKESSQ